MILYKMTFLVSASHGKPQVTCKLFLAKVGLLEKHKNENHIAHTTPLLGLIVRQECCWSRSAKNDLPELVGGDHFE